MEQLHINKISKTPSLTAKRRIENTMEDLEMPSADAEEDFEFWKEDVEEFMKSLGHNKRLEENIDSEECNLPIKIEPTIENSIGCSVSIKIGFKKNYPYKPPSLRVIKSLNMKGAIVDILQDSIFKRANKFSINCAKKGKRKHGLITSIVKVIEAKLDEYVKTKNIEISPSNTRMTPNDDLEDFLKLQVVNRHKKGPLLKNIICYSDFEIDAKREGKESYVVSKYANDFEEISKLGSGGSGHVYLVKNKTNSQLYAIKKIMLSRNSEYNDLMMHEVSLFSRLNHPNIVRYYDSWLENVNRNALSSYESDEEVFTESKLSEIAEEYESSAVVFLPAESEPENSRSSRSDYSEEEKVPIKQQVDGKVTMLYIQMEYCEGATLASYITAKQGIKCEERWRFFRETLEALAYLHGRSLVHRDMKPSNIFLTKDKNIKLGDFGLAVKALPVKQLKGNTKEEDKTENNGEGKVCVGVGTPFYRSKEQENGENPIDKSDIYSLGIILFELCYYFSTLMERSVVLTNLREKWEFPEDFNEKVEGNQEVKKLIIQCLQDQPADRPSAIEILQRYFIVYNYSELLPKRIEDKEFDKFTKIIDDRTAVESSKLMSFLFLQGNDTESEYIKEDMIFGYTTKLRPEIINNITEIYRRHCAIPMEVIISIRNR